ETHRWIRNRVRRLHCPQAMISPVTLARHDEHRSWCRVSALAVDSDDGGGCGLDGQADAPVRIGGHSAPLTPPPGIPPDHPPPGPPRGRGLCSPPLAGPAGGFVSGRPLPPPGPRAFFLCW